MRIRILLISILVIPFLWMSEIKARGVSAGTRITNYAIADFTYGLSTSSVTNSISTQVMAIYGMQNINGGTNGYTYPGATYTFPYSISNIGNTDVTLRIILSNFNPSMSSNSVTNWRAWISAGPVTSSIITGTSPVTSITFSTNILEFSYFSYNLNIQTSSGSLLMDRGFLPMVAIVSGQGTNVGNYIGDNLNAYGGTNYNIMYPNVTILAPYINLRKALTISNQPAYLAAGGVANVPVPDSIITYTNFYDNDGNARATNLVIIDTIPTDTDFIPGTINIVSHTNSGVASGYTVSYYNGTSWSATLPATTPGPYGENRLVRRIRITFTAGLSENDGDNPNTADAPYQDSDAGYIYYKVVVNRRD